MGIHIGKKIKEELYQQGISVSTFAKKINRSRNVVYDIFERESIDTSLLNKISLILRIDFFSVYSEQKEYKKDHVEPLVIKDERVVYAPLAEQVKILEEKNEILMKEIDYLKKIIKLMEEKTKPKGRKKIK
jgi:transcriptional regulator with XRE-family HTH domain